MKPGETITTFEDKKHHSVRIMTIAASDLDDLLAYVNRLIAEDTTVLLSGKPISYKEEKKYVQESVKSIKEGKSVRLIARIGEKIVATGDIRIGRLRKLHVAEFGISVDKAYRDSGIGKKFLSVMIEMSKRMGLRLITLTCFANNDRAIHVYESLGFVHAGLIPKAILFQGSYIDEATLYLPLT